MRLLENLLVLLKRLMVLRESSEGLLKVRLSGNRLLLMMLKNDLLLLRLMNDLLLLRLLNDLLLLRLMNNLLLLLRLMTDLLLLLLVLGDGEELILLLQVNDKRRLLLSLITNHLLMMHLQLHDVIVRVLKHDGLVLVLIVTLLITSDIDGSIVTISLTIDASNIIDVGTSIVIQTRVSVDAKEVVVEVFKRGSRWLVL